MSINLSVYIEIKGNPALAGHINGDHTENARFTYDESYMSAQDSRPISIALPFSTLPYSPGRTRCFFDGLLPEGYTRRCIAEEMRIDVQDWLSLLKELGRECLGAILITDEFASDSTSQYQELTTEQLKRFATEGADESAVLVAKSHLSLTGASGKTGLYLDPKQNKWFLPVGTAPSTHIVKQSHVRLKKIVANEQLCLLTAEKMGISVPQSFIISFDDISKDHVLFATRRYDRKILPDCKRINGLSVPYRLHQEDFAQALGIPAIRKYEKNTENYLAKMFRLLRDYSSNPLEDQMKLWDICIFNYFIGNTDNHLKNLSLLYSEDLKSIRLAPAYDMLSTLIYENSTDEMAFRIGDASRIHEITRDSFRREAKEIGIGEKIAMNHLDKMASGFEKSLRESCEELCRQGFDEAEEIALKILNNFKNRVDL